MQHIKSGNRIHCFQFCIYALKITSSLAVKLLCQSWVEAIFMKGNQQFRIQGIKPSRRHFSCITGQTMYI